MRILIALVIAFVGCRGEPPAPVQPGPVRISTPTSADPWVVAARPDDPPDLAERHRIANEACPRVLAPYFFRIEKAGKVSHILGTRHVGVPLAKFPAPVHDALAAAKLAVFEVAPDDESDLPDAKVFLPDELGPALWKRFQALVGERDAQTLQSTSPSAALLSLVVLYEDITAMLDVEIENQVIAAKVPTRGLESSEFQDRLLDKLLDLRMLRAALAGIENRAELERESRDELAKYCTGTDDEAGMDADERADLLASGYTNAEIDQIDEEMIYARNADWIPKLERILATGDVFIAVGADHLRGPRGVVALLAKRGYKLTRITE